MAYDGTTTQTVAYVSDIASNSSNLLAANNSWTGSNTFTQTINGNLSGNVTGNLTGNVTGNVTGNASTATLAAAATQLANTPTGCTAPAYAVSIDAFGNLSCTQVGFAQVSGTDTAHSNIVYNNQANTYTAGDKQSFVADATNAGMNVTGVTADPTTVAAGDVWFRTDLTHLFAYDGTTTQTVAYVMDIASNSAATCWRRTTAGRAATPSRRRLTGTCRGT